MVCQLHMWLFLSFQVKLWNVGCWNYCEITLSISTVSPEVRGDLEGQACQEPGRLWESTRPRAKIGWKAFVPVPRSIPSVRVFSSYGVSPPPLQCHMAIYVNMSLQLTRRPNKNLPRVSPKFIPLGGTPGITFDLPALNCAYVRCNGPGRLWKYERTGANRTPPA